MIPVSSTGVHCATPGTAGSVRPRDRRHRSAPPGCTRPPDRVLEAAYLALARHVQPLTRPPAERLDGPGEIFRADSRGSDRWHRQLLALLLRMWTYPGSRRRRWEIRPWASPGTVRSGHDAKTFADGNHPQTELITPAEALADWPWFAHLMPDVNACLFDRATLAAAARAIGPRCSSARIAEAYQALLAYEPTWERGRPGLAPVSTGPRRRGGSYYTPPLLAATLAHLALAPVLASCAGNPTKLLAVRICDPACGDGRFLLAAADCLARALHAAGWSLKAARAAVADRCLFGMDCDSLTVELCRLTLARWSDRASDPGSVDHVVVGDALLGDTPAHWPATFDVVLGNPPFLGQLRTHSARSPAARDALARQFPDAMGPYTDTAALFLLRAVHMTRPGGRVMLVQPQSLLAARDAGPVRRALMSRAVLGGLWITSARLFDCSVRVCAPLLIVRSPAERSPADSLSTALVPVWRGVSVPADLVRGSEARSAAGACSRARRPREIVHLSDRFGTWAPLAACAMGVPPVPDDVFQRTLAEICTATADFRDQYYALRQAAVEDDTLMPDRRGSYPRLITAGLIEPGRLMWGRRACRLFGRCWRAPRADLAMLAGRGAGAWLSARLVPKVLVATQTRVLEAAADPAGDCLPVTPVITVYPAPGVDVWEVAAAVLSPVAAVAAAWRCLGTGLSPGTMRVSASQLLALPAPRDMRPWREAADLLRTATDSDTPREHARRLETFGHLMCRACGLTPAASRRLVTWWQAALGSIRQHRAGSRALPLSR